jgi:hypothetical protein
MKAAAWVLVHSTIMLVGLMFDGLAPGGELLAC